MALTVTSRGTGTHNTGATTLVPGGRSATLAVGSMGVLCISADNAGAAGAALMAPDSWTDAKGNVWTLRINALYDNGAASAGIEMMFYTAPIKVALLTTDAGTMTWKGGVSPVAKAWTWYEVAPSGANTVQYSTGGSIAGATAANAQVTTASVLVGDAVIAGYFSENVAAVTGDSDTTNGTWAAQQTTTIGTTTSGVRIATQAKVQTTAASTQSYDVTVSSQDRIAGYIMLHETNFTGYAAEVMADSPIAYWRLGEPSGTVAKDVIGTHHGTYVNTPTLGQAGAIVGDADTAVHFTAAQSEYINFPGYVTLPALISIEAWINSEGNAQTDVGIAAWEGGGTLRAELSWYASSQTIQWGVTTASDATMDVTGLAQLVAAGWHHVVGTYDGTQARLYLDGALIGGPTSFTYVGGTGTDNFKIGQYGALAGTYGTFSVDEVAIYDTALSLTRIAAHYAAGQPAAANPPYATLYRQLLAQ